MQALVTGGSGFIGSELIRGLTAKGIRVKALLRKTSSLKNLEGVEYETVYGDVTDSASLKEAVKGVDYVFHLAGVISAKNRDGYFRANAEGTGNLAKACKEFNPGLKRFVYVSSVAAAGPSDNLDPRSEGQPEQPVSTYGASKLGGEQELKRWASYPYSIVRPPIVYGPRDRGLFEFFRLVKGGVVPVLRGRSETGEKYYSVVHVLDLVAGILEAGLHEGLDREETFFISGDGFFTWSKLMDVMGDSLGKKPLKVCIPSPMWTGLAFMFSGVSFLTRRQGPLTIDKLNELRPDYWICSNDRAKTRLGYKPKYSLEHGIKETAEWYKQHGWL